MKITKNRKNILESLDLNKIYEPIEAIKLLKEKSFVKFNETIDVSINLGIDSNKSDQNIKGLINLPKGTGKKIKVAVITSPQKQEDANQNGADLVGGDELIEKIKSTKIDFDILIASPDVMPALGKVAKILGPKGLMPNPKLGTVTDDLKKAVLDAKSGQAEIKNDKDGNIGLSFGKKSFSDEKLIQNFNAIIDVLEREKGNQTIKGDLVKSAFITSTMGVSYRLKLPKSI